LYRKLDQYDVIIAPGDSPAKFVNVFRLCGFDVSKFVQFPISGLGERGGISEKQQETLDEYVALVLKDVNITEVDKVTFFDFISTGASIKYMKKSIVKLYPDIDCDIVDIPRVTSKNQGVYCGLMMEGEMCGTRAVRSFPISKFNRVVPPLEASNVWKCNLICLIVALNCLGRLENVGDTNPKTLSHTESRFNCSYYDFEAREIRYSTIITLPYETTVYRFDPGQTEIEFDTTPEMKLFSIFKRQKNCRH